MTESGALSFKERAGVFDIEPRLISKWLAASRVEGSEACRGRGVCTEVRAQNAWLKKENSDLKQE